MSIHQPLLLPRRFLKFIEPFKFVVRREPEAHIRMRPEIEDFAHFDNGMT